MPTAPDSDDQGTCNWLSIPEPTTRQQCTNVPTSVILRKQKRGLLTPKARSTTSTKVTRRIGILGSTGSIGTQALHVVTESAGLLQPVLLSSGHRVEPLLEQANQFHPESIVLIDPDQELPKPTAQQDDSQFEIQVGSEAQLQAIRELDLDLVLNGITGAAGLRASLTTLECGIDLALANKESLVTAGPLLISAAKKSGARILPVDSEHAAILQCIADSDRSTITRIIITASGGPFRGSSRSDLLHITPEQALAHPTWNMGARISVDSATLFNKALELIEAQHLFGRPDKGLEVLIHPQSVVHAIVEFQDGSSIAQLGEPDMRVPIRGALYPGDRPAGDFRPLDLLSRGQLNFEEVDSNTFPALKIAQAALDHPNSSYGAVLNAADEEAVAAFLSGDVGFLQIFDLVEKAMQQHSPMQVEDLDQIIEVDHTTRERVRSWTT